MDRRRFLRYAGACAAVVGASALGLDYLLTQPGQSGVGSTTSATSTIPLSGVTVSSSTRSGLVYRGKGWYDYDGDTVQGTAKGIDTVKNTRWEEAEPDEQFYVMAYDSKGNFVKGAYSNGKGEFQLDGLDAGTYNIKFCPYDPKDLESNIPKILESWYKKLDPWGMGNGDVNAEYEKMVKNDPSKAVFLWHRFFGVGGYGNILLNMRDGGRVNLTNSVTYARIGFTDGPFTLPFDNSQNVTDFQDYHHPIDSFANWQSGVKDWRGERVVDYNIGYFDHPHEAADLKPNDCGEPVRNGAPGRGNSASISNIGQAYYYCTHGNDTVTSFAIYSGYAHFLSMEKDKIGKNINRGEEIGKCGRSGDPPICHDHNFVYLKNLNPQQNEPSIKFVDHFAPLWPISGYLSHIDPSKYIDGYTRVPFSENPGIFGMWTRTNKPTYPSLT